jgi:hypothetical protein
LAPSYGIVQDGAARDKSEYHSKPRAKVFELKDKLTPLIASVLNFGKGLGEPEQDYVSKRLRHNLGWEREQNG